MEYINDYDRMGCFERVISEIDALNIVTSDRVNDIVQCVQSLLWVHNAELPKDENGNATVRNGALIETKSTGNGHDPKMAYLSKEMSQDGIQTLTQNFIDRIHEKTNVPGRQEQGGGSTGSAMSLSNGWQAAELSALKKSQLTKKSEKECIRIMLEIFSNDPDVPEEVRNLKLADIEPKFDRNRTVIWQRKSIPGQHWYRMEQICSRQRSWQVLRPMLSSLYWIVKKWSIRFWTAN